MNRHVRPQSDGERRSFVLSAVVRALGVAALDFVLLRIWAPDLVDQHQDLALAGAIFLGGPVLFPLVSTMVFGIIIGTYSSVYVALPIILLWGVRRGDEDAVPLKPATVR